MYIYISSTRPRLAKVLAAADAAAAAAGDVAGSPDVADAHFIIRKNKIK